MKEDILQKLVDTTYKSLTQELEEEVNELKAKCSSNGIGGKSYLNQLYRIMLKDVQKRVDSTYNDYLHIFVNDKHTISTEHLAERIRSAVKNIYDDYRSIIGSSGDMIRIEIKENDISSFMFKVEEKLDKEISRVTAQYKQVVNKESYKNKSLWLPTIITSFLIILGWFVSPIITEIYDLKYATPIKTFFQKNTYIQLQNSSIKKHEKKLIDTVSNHDY